MRFILILLGMLYLFPINLYSNSTMTHWFFGQNIGLDFSNNKVVQTTGELNTFETSASMSDPDTGELLFYTDGIKVYNKEHKVMDSGHFLNICHYSFNSSTQGVIVIPNPMNENEYYIFTAFCSESSDYLLTYHIVDMSKNEDLGKVVSYHNLLIENVTENVIATPMTDGKGYWLLTHGLNNNEFYSFKISDNGLETTPEVSMRGDVHLLNTDYESGYMKFSNDGNQIAVSTYTNNSLQLFDFNKTTGRVSPPLTLPSNGTEYGVAFSPDNTKLYVSTKTETSELNYLYQYDLSATDIAASRLIIHEFVGKFGAIQKGADNKLYVSKWGKSLGIIHLPNCIGEEAKYNHEAMRFDNLCTFGLPNFVEYDLGDKHGDFKLDFLVENHCVTRTSSFNLIADERLEVEEWLCEIHDESGNLLISTQETSFEYVFPTEMEVIITLIAQTGCDSDTLIRKLMIYPNIQAFLETPQFICSEMGGLGVDATVYGGYDYLWSNGDNSAISTFYVTDSIWVHISNPGCEDIDSVAVYLIEKDFKVDIGKDTLICIRDYYPEFELSTNYYDFLEYQEILWNTGETTPEITITESGIYSVEVRLGDCVEYDEIEVIIVRDPTFVRAIPTAFSPNGDDRNDCFKVHVEEFGRFELIIYNRWGEKVFQSENIDECWDGTDFRGEDVPIGVYQCYIVLDDCFNRKKEGFISNLTIIR